MVETAILIPVILLITFGLIEFSSAYRSASVATAASRSAARTASAEVKTLLQQATNYPGTNPGRTFASFFRQWVTLCTVNTPVQGTYFLEVQTNKKIDGTNAPNGGGSNRFAVRVGAGSNYAVSNGLKIYGNQRMGAYANATGANTQFSLTRILPGEAGKTLVLNFYDTGDASQAGTLAVLPPADSNVAGGLFTGCLFTLPPGNSTGPPWGSFAATAAGCKITGVSNSGSNSYNGQWVTWRSRYLRTTRATSRSRSGAGPGCSSSTRAARV